MERPRNELLLIPGPTEVSERVLRAMFRPALGSGDPRFVDTLEKTCDMLRSIFKTKNEIIIPSGSGTFATEAAAVSLIEPGDKVLVAVNGVYGRQFRDVIQRVGGDPIELNVDWRDPVGPEMIKEKLETVKDIKIVCIVHSETTTCIANPISEIGKITKDYGCLYVVDTVSSLGGMDVHTDEWNIDINCSGAQKCLGGLPGLAIVSVSDRAWQSMSKRRCTPSSFSLDLYRWMQLWIPRERGGKLIWGQRKSPYTLSTHLVYALNEALKIILEEGLENVLVRHKRSAIAMRTGLKTIGFELYGRKEEFASDVVTGIVNPKGIRTDIMNVLREQFGIIVGGGLEDLTGKIIRIAHMCNTANKLTVIRVLSAFEDIMTGQGWKFTQREAVEAALRIFA